jgi:low affinity sulfate transporter 2
MGSQPIQTFSVEERRRRHLNMEDATSQLEMAQWVLNSPDPPGLLQELGSSVREIIFPHGKKHTSSTARRKQQSRAMEFLQGVFPILRWGRDYKASMFKNDLMAGLTLASLSIPQV